PIGSWASVAQPGKENEMAHGLKRIHWLVVVCCLLGANALGQQAGQIVGVVTDSSGGVVPAITIKASEVATGFIQSTVTGEDGRFVFPNLRPTHYEIS